MPFAKTEPLRRELADALPHRRVTVGFWDGTQLPPTTASGDGVGKSERNGDGQSGGNGDHTRNGGDETAVPSRGPTFIVRSPKAVAHVVRAPGELGLGRAYVAGDLEVDDLDHVIDLIEDFEEPQIDRVTRARLAIAALRACGLTIPPRAPKGELRLKGRSHRKG